MWIYKELFIATLWKVLELKPKLSSCIFFFLPAFSVSLLL